jgi:GMP synthase (glutamine-hydrolysing)
LLEGLENANIKEKAAHIFNIPIENIQIKNFKDKATGIKNDKRLYGKIIGIKIKNLKGKILQASYKKLVALQTKVIENSTITRILYSIKDLQEKKAYVIGIRSVQTKKFLTAEISEIPWKTLVKISEKVTKKCMNVSTVYYDITSKPPATIEME